MIEEIIKRFEKRKVAKRHKKAINHILNDFISIEEQRIVYEKLNPREKVDFFNKFYEIAKNKIDSLLDIERYASMRADYTIKSLKNILELLKEDTCPPRGPNKVYYKIVGRIPTNLFVG